MTKNDLAPAAKKLLKTFELEQVFATSHGEFYTNPETAKVVHGQDIEIYTFTKVKK